MYARLCGEATACNLIWFKGFGSIDKFALLKIQQKMAHNKARTGPRSAARFKPEVHPRSVSLRWSPEVN